MRDLQQFYINGSWIEPQGCESLTVTNPATEEAFATIRLGNEAYVDEAVGAARLAFIGYSQSSREERIALLERIISVYQGRLEELAQAISLEMGAPISLARKAQAPAGLGHFQMALEVLKNYSFEESLGTTRIMREPAGVCAFITPWNWPLNQIACKVAPALAAGCTMVLKPSEVAPVSAHLLAEILDEAGVPAGVFNLVDGDGLGVGSPLSSHPGVDLVSFTGSTRAGTLVSKAAADTVKRVALELGGKSANIILLDADFEKAVKRGVQALMNNSGQSCNGPTRMLVPEDRHQEAIAIARNVVESLVVGNPEDETTAMGPVASEVQWTKIQGLIEQGVREGAELVCGGPGKPEGLERGHFVKPTVFANVRNDMVIAREEIFGPVLSILPYRDEQEAVAIANDSPFGLSGYVWGSLERARAVASQLRTGNVHLNGAPQDYMAPFGGYGQSGVGREWGVYGFEEFLEVKAVMGYETA